MNFYGSISWLRVRQLLAHPIPSPSSCVYLVEEEFSVFEGGGSTHQSTFMHDKNKKTTGA